MLSMILETAGLISLSIGIVSTGITVEDPTYWFLIVGLILYVKFGGKK